MRYNYRLYPTGAQIHTMKRQMETLRHYWNDLFDLPDSQLLHPKEKGNGVYAIMPLNTPYRKEVYAASFTAVIDTMQKALVAAKKGTREKPHPKRFGTPMSICYPSAGQGVKIGWRSGKIQFSKIGYIKALLHRPLPEGAAVGGATIKRESDGKWYVSFVVRCSEKALPAPPPTPSVVGADAGLGEVLVFSDGRRVDPLRDAKDRKPDLKRTQRLHRNLSRKERGSKNQEKARLRLARHESRIARRNDDYLRNLALNTVRRYDITVIETLSVKEMMEKRTSHGLNRSFASGALSTLAGYLKEAAAKEMTEGRWKMVHTLSKQDTRGTTQTCSQCGHLPSQKLLLKDRVYECGHCGIVADRDLNASHNILNRGLEDLRQVMPEVKPVEHRCNYSLAMKQERARERMREREVMTAPGRPLEERSLHENVTTMPLLESSTVLRY